MADKTLNEIIVEALREDVAIYAEIAGLRDSALAAEYRRAQEDYDAHCADYVEAGEAYMPVPPKKLGKLLQACIQRLES